MLRVNALKSACASASRFIFCSEISFFTPAENDGHSCSLCSAVFFAFSVLKPLPSILLLCFFSFISNVHVRAALCAALFYSPPQYLSQYCSISVQTASLCHPLRKQDPDAQAERSICLSFCREVLPPSQRNDACRPCIRTQP